MVYHTFVSGEVLTAANVMNDLMNQSVIVCTSGTRPASPVAGMTIYETDTLAMRIYNGTTWLRAASTDTGSWTCNVITGGSTWTPSSHSEFYVVSGGLCHAWAYNVGPNPGTGSGNWGISWSGLPTIHASWPGGTSGGVIGTFDASGRGNGDVRRTGTATADLISAGNVFNTAWSNGPVTQFKLSFPVSA